MEVWILLAAAGSGYLARRWQNAQKPKGSPHSVEQNDGRDDETGALIRGPPNRGKYRRFSSLNAKQGGKLFGKRNGLRGSGNITEAKHRDKVSCDSANSKHRRENCEGKGSSVDEKDPPTSRNIVDGNLKGRVNCDIAIQQHERKHYEGKFSSGCEKDHVTFAKIDDNDLSAVNALPGHLSTMDLNSICENRKTEDVVEENNERIDIETGGALPGLSSERGTLEGTHHISLIKSFSGKRANDNGFEKARKSGYLIQEGLSGKRIKDVMYQRSSQSEGSMFSTWMPGFWDVSEGVFVLDTESLLVHETENKNKGSSSRKIRTPNKYGKSKCSRKKFLAPHKPMTSLESCLSAQLDEDEKRETIDNKEVLGMSSDVEIQSQPSTDMQSYSKQQLGGDLVTGLPSLSSRINFKDHRRKWGTKETVSERVTGGDKLESSGTIKHMRGKKNLEREWETFCKGQSGKSLDDLSAANEYTKVSAQISAEGIVYNFGVGVGMMFTFLSNKREVRRLTSLLEEAELIIKGLENELERRCGLGNELISYERNYEQIQSATVRCTAESLNDMGNILNEFDHSESNDITALEAELEAELERMDMSLGNGEKYKDENSSDTSDCHVEVGNLVQGELRTSGLPYEFEEDESNENHSDSSPEEFHDGNYAVSPRELAKRLHEVLALQQEQQISDLETQLKLMEIKLQNKEAELQFLKLGPVDRFQGRDSGFAESYEASRTHSHPEKLSEIKGLPKRFSRNHFLCSGSRNASPVSPKLACTNTVSLKSSGITGLSEKNNNVFITLGDVGDVAVAACRNACNEIAEDISSPIKRSLGGALTNHSDEDNSIKVESRNNCNIHPAQLDADNVEHVDLLSLAEDFCVGYELEITENMPILPSKGRRYPRRRNSRNKGSISNHPEPEQFHSTLRGVDSSDDTANDTSVSTPCSVKLIDARTTGVYCEDSLPLPDWNFGASSPDHVDSYMDRLDSPNGYELPFECEDFSAPEDCSSELDEQLGKLLIKRIVEKSRKGSPIIQDAQIVLASFESATE